jgi:hypothetical protein
MVKEIYKKFPATAIGLALIGLLLVEGLFVGKDSVITNAMIQAGWCSLEDYICVLQFYSVIALTLILVSLVIDSIIRRWNNRPARGYSSNYLEQPKPPSKSSPTLAPEKLKWTAIEYHDETLWGDHIATYAAIRIDNGIDCRKLVARLITIKSIGMGQELDLNKINPTGANLTWNSKDNHCILHVIQERGETAEILFANGRRSPPLTQGNYEIKLLITGPQIQPTEIIKRLRISRPHHYHRTHKTGLQWSE